MSTSRGWARSLWLDDGGAAVGMADTPVALICRIITDGKDSHLRLGPYAPRRDAARVWELSRAPRVADQLCNVFRMSTLVDSMLRIEQELLHEEANVLAKNVCLSYCSAPISQ